MEKAKEIKSLQAALEKEKNSSTPKARSIRKQLRKLGFFLSKQKSGEKKSAVKKAPVKKSTKKEIVVEDDDDL